MRVELATAHVPTSSSPARITARGGSWSSSTFISSHKPVIFPADSYVQLVSDAAGWRADVYDPTGTLLASSPTSDIVIDPTDDATLLEMKWRDSRTQYDLYRGSMRLLVNGSGVQAINSVTMNDYLRGVVPAEMPPTWAAEAVKAQAVAARSYAYVRLKPGQRVRRRAQRQQPGLRAAWCSSTPSRIGR